MTAVDLTASNIVTPSAPSSFPEAVTNDVEFTNVSRGLYIGVAGDVSIVTMAGVTVLFKNAIAGTIIPIRAKKVNAAGTTATNIVALG